MFSGSTLRLHLIHEDAEPNQHQNIYNIILRSQNFCDNVILYEFRCSVINFKML